MNVMSKQKARPALPKLSPVQTGLSTAVMYQLIERARDAYNDLDEQHLKIPKEAHLESRLNLAHQKLVWEYQDAIAQAATFLKPCNMNDVYAMLRLTDDRLEDLVAHDREANGVDIDAELLSLRRMVRGCLPILAAEVGAELDQTLQYLCASAFVDVPK